MPFMRTEDARSRPNNIHSNGYISYRPDIDGLRALAILPVIGYHAFPGVFAGGFVGVDIFFVISGFLISSIIFKKLEQGSFSATEFYSRRIRRIFPALVLVLFSCFAAGWILLDADELQQLGKHIAGGAGFISNFILQSESGYFDTAADEKPLLHLWSLGIEEQFYICWPLLLGLVWKYRHNFLITTLGIAVASFAANIYLLTDSAVAAFYSPFSRFWELMAGGILAYHVLHRNRFLQSGQDAQSLAGLILIVLSVLLINDSRDFPGWWTLMPVAGAFLLISAGQLTWINRRILSSGVLVRIGLISYPLYLWHWPLLAFARIDAGETPSAGIRAAAVATAFMLAWLTYVLVEKPVHFGGSSRRKTLSLCLLMILVGYAGFYAYHREGLAFRKRYDWKSGYRDGKCFISTDEKNSGPDRFAEYCSGIADPSRPTVLLWGDSHAASLYPGLKNKADAYGFNLAQFNAGGCPPITGFSPDGRAVCPDINRYVASVAETIRPDTVVLAANWLMYIESGKLTPAVYEQLKATIGHLRDIPVRNIAVVGQLPVFESAQPKVGKKVFRPNRQDRTLTNLDMMSFDSNNRLKAFAHKNATQFISPMDLLCNAEGCLVSDSLHELNPLAWDRSHLTGRGSVLLVDLALANRQLDLPVP